MITPRPKIPGARAVPRPPRGARAERAENFRSPRLDPALRPGTGRAPGVELANLHARLAIAEETIRAIRSGEVDSVLIAGKEGSQVFTLEGAGHAYRLLIESMNEGALTVTADKTILFANQCFANLVKCPLEQVTGSSFRRFLSEEDRRLLRPLMKRAALTGTKLQVLLKAGDGSLIPVLLSIRELANEGSKDVLIGMVVTNMKEARRSEDRLRALTQRVVQGQETERAGVALELHDHITQLLCAILVRCQTLANELPPQACPARREATKLRDMVGAAAREVERISRHLRPSVLQELGLGAVVRSETAEFAERTGLALQVTFGRLTARLAGAAELALYRILQEALQNIAQHAQAHQITVRLTQQGNLVQLSVQDDGIGFDVDARPARHKIERGLGLLSMRERVTGVGGRFNIRTAPDQGTTIRAQIPLPKIARAAPRGRRAQPLELL